VPQVVRTIERTDAPDIGDAVLCENATRVIEKSLGSQEIKAVDVATGKMIWKTLLPGSFPGPVADRRIAIDESKRLGATASAAGGIVVFLLDSGTVTNTLLTASKCQAITFVADGRFAVADQDGRVFIVSSIGAAEPEQISQDLPRGGVESLAASPDGTLLAVGGVDSSIRLFDVRTKRQIRELRGHNGPVLFLRFVAGGQRLLSGSGDATARLWDPANGAEVCCFTGHERAVTCADLSPDGTRLVTGSEEAHLRFFDPSDGTLVYLPQSHLQWRRAVQFDPTGDRLLVAGWTPRTSVQIYDIRRECARIDGSMDAEIRAALSAGQPPHAILDNLLTHLSDPEQRQNARVLLLSESIRNVTAALHALNPPFSSAGAKYWPYGTSPPPDDDAGLLRARDVCQRILNQATPPGSQPENLSLRQH
jgi:WD40 repeat protein